MADPSYIPSVIDHTNLRADARERDIAALCAEARQYGFHAVCIAPCFIGLAVRELAGSGVGVCTVVGYPLGNSMRPAKAREAELAAHAGADEIDMVMNIGAARDGRWDEVRREIEAVARATGPLVLKVIIECCYLSDGQKVGAVEAAVAGGAHFVKTSTGMGPWGATVGDVRIIGEAAGGRVRIKASGGIRTLDDVVRMLDAGASRIGTSSAVEVMKRLLQ